VEIRTIVPLLAADLATLDPPYSVTFIPGRPQRTEVIETPSGLAIYVPNAVGTSSYPEIVVRNGDEHVATMWFFADDQPLDDLAQTLGNMQIDVIDYLWDVWPPCPAHSHPVDIVERGGRLAWICPATQQAVAWFGELAQIAAD
jgi:hypothetical protein